MKKFICLIFLLISSLSLTACQQEASGGEKGLKIVTSFYPIYSMVKEVSGELNDVRMIQSKNGIHDYEPSATDVAAISDADIFIYHSSNLESWAASLDSSLQDSKVQVIEASDGMKFDRVTGLEDLEDSQKQDEKAFYDPHSWLDPGKVAEEVDLIAQKLAAIDPENKDQYEKNAEKIKKQCQTLIDKYQGSFEKASQKTFVTQHTAFSYLAKRFGLTQLGIAGISPEQEPSPRQLTEMADFIKTYKVKTIFIESNASRKLAETVSQSTGARLKVLNPLEADPGNNKTYLENLEENLKTLSEELT